MNRESDVHEKNLTQGDAAKKIRELAQATRVCFFGTRPSVFRLTVRPMAVQEVDEEGNLWFLSGRSSSKNLNIARDPRVHLLFGNPGDSQYLSLHGTATISDDRGLLEKHWTPMAESWFPGGVDDLELTVIKVAVVDGYYCDTEDGKAVSLLKVAVGAVIGKGLDDGSVGRVRP